ncbi:MAG: hypothetical protein HC892_04760 [Saprospiraceae bacterium]|nr:hypothetical protein [Saprospiraceae bacterium]
MRMFYLGLTLLLACQWGISQHIETLEANLPNQIGEQYAKDALQIATHYYLMGNYEKAMQHATLAENKANQLSSPELLALALNRQAKILLRMPGS